MAVVTDAWRDGGRVEVWDVRRGTRVARLEGTPLDYDGDRWVTFTPDGDRLAVLDEDRRVVWWRVDPDDAEPLGRLRQTSGDSLRTARLRGDRLRLLSDKDDRTLALSPTTWHTRLGAAVGALEMARQPDPCPSD